MANIVSIAQTAVETIQGALKSGLQAMGGTGNFMEAAVLIALGLVLMAYFAGSFPRWKLRFGGDRARDQLDRDTLKILKDLERQARDFDSFISEKIFEEGAAEGMTASDENWDSRSTAARAQQRARPTHLRLIKTPEDA